MNISDQNKLSRTLPVVDQLNIEQDEIFYKSLSPIPTYTIKKNEERKDSETKFQVLMSIFTCITFVSAFYYN